MRLAILAVIVAGCTGSATGPAWVAPANVVAPAPPAARVRDWMAMDYSLPSDDASVIGPAMQELQDFLERCARGDREGCLHAIGTFGPVEPFDREVEHCRAGDLESCRTVAPYAPVGVLGTADHTCITGCDVPALQRECDLGFPSSCHQLAEHTQDPIAAIRAAKLALEGCRRDRVHDCDLAKVIAPTQALRDEAATLGCRFDGSMCIVMGARFLARHDLARARQFFELGCQRRRHCIGAYIGYREAHIPEPVPGRMAAVKEQACENPDVPCETTTGYLVARDLIRSIAPSF